MHHRLALHVCHRCFTPIPTPAKPKKDTKALEAARPEGEAEKAAAEAAEGEQQQQQQVEEETPPALDPCLPRYCPMCAGKNAELDARWVFNSGP